MGFSGFTHTGFLGGKIGGKALQIGVCITAASGFLLFGYDQGIMAGIISEPMFLKDFPLMDSNYKDGSIQALVVAIYEIGCLLGSFFIIGYGDKLGRRKSVLIGTTIMLVGTAIQTASVTMGMLIAGRIITGVGNGMNTSSIPVWQSEMAPPKIRGFLVLFEGALITGGICVSYWINYGFWFVTQYGSFQWRFPIAFQAVFGFLLILGVLAYPESPRWLLKHGKEDAARDIMAHLYDSSTDDQRVNAEVEDIQKINAITGGKKLTFKEFFSKGPEMNRWRATIAFCSQAFQQIGGLNLVTYYATTVFEDSLGFDAELSRLMTGCLGTEFFIAALVALFIVDRLGRRTLMLWGAVGMAISLLVVGACLAPGTKPAALAATVFIFVYNSFFAMGWLGVTWLYPAEITPIRIRAEANGLSTSANWIFNYAVVQLAPIMINKIAWETYFVFMCFNFAFIPIVYFTFVETNGYPLEKMDAIFAEAYEKNENPVWTERRVRKGEKLDVEKTLEDAERLAENRGDVPRRSQENSDSDWEKSRSNQKEMN